MRESKTLTDQRVVVWPPSEPVPGLFDDLFDGQALMNGFTRKTGLLFLNASNIFHMPDAIFSPEDMLHISVTHQASWCRFDCCLCSGKLKSGAYNIFALDEAILFWFNRAGVTGKLSIPLRR